MFIVGCGLTVGYDSAKAIVWYERMLGGSDGVFMQSVKVNVGGWDGVGGRECDGPL